MGLELAALFARDTLATPPRSELQPWDILLNTESAFHIMKADESTNAKFKTCASDCRGLDRFEERKDNMVSGFFSNCRGDAQITSARAGWKKEISKNLRASRA
jgi:hypothetical protein